MKFSHAVTLLIKGSNLCQFGGGFEFLLTLLFIVVTCRQIKLEKNEEDDISHHKNG